MEKKQVSKTENLVPWLIWLAMSIYVIFQQYTGTFYGLTAEQLAKMYAVDKSRIPTMAGLFFLSYGVMQIPAGLIMDRFNKKLVLCAAAAVAVGGMLLMTLIHSFPVGCVAAIILGAGTAFAFVGGALLFIDWFPARQFAFVMGLMGGAGCIGTAALCTVTTSVAAKTSINLLLSGLTLFGILAFVMILFFVREKEKNGNARDPEGMGTPAPTVLVSLGQVFKNRQSWLAALYNAALLGPALAFSSFWNFAYQKTYGHDVASSVMINNMIWVGLAVGAPLIGWLSDRVKRRVLPAQLACLGALTCMILILSDLFFSTIAIGVIMFVYGGFSNANAVGFALAKEHTEPAYHGTVTGFVNTVTFCIITALQILPGVFLGRLKTFFSEVYTYHSAFVILTLVILGAMGATMFMKETHGEPQR